jgi:hypothetical protein
MLTDSYGDGFMSATREDGSNVINNRIRSRILKRISTDPKRYPRQIDAALLEDEIDIICNPTLYEEHFGAALGEAFPGGRDEARTFLARLVQPRNKLSHANPISVREAEQVTCYSHDVIDSLKHYYAEENVASQYNAPTIIRVTDSLGHSTHASQIQRNNTGAGLIDTRENAMGLLRPGDTLSIEVEVDPSFQPEEYEVTWIYSSNRPTSEKYEGSRLILELRNEHVKEDFAVYCLVRSNKDWHRLGDSDDSVAVIYRVLPPV